MSRNRIHHSCGPVETYRIVNAAGEEVTSFTLNDKQPSITIHLERGSSVLENPIRRLEREAWSYCEALMRALTEIEKIDPAAALDLYAKMFEGDDSAPKPWE